MQTRTILFAVAVAVAGVALPAAAGDFDGTAGYYGTRGDHQALDTPDGGLEKKDAPSSDAFFAQIAKQSPKGGGDIVQREIERARIAVSFAPAIRDELDASKAPEGQLGRDEKLNEASRLATAGKRAARATAAQLFSVAHDYLNSLDPESQRIGHALMDEGTRMKDVGEIWKDNSADHVAKSHEITRDYAGGAGAQAASSAAPSTTAQAGAVRAAIAREGGTFKEAPAERGAGTVGAAVASATASGVGTSYAGGAASRYGAGTAGGMAARDAGAAGSPRAGSQTSGQARAAGSGLVDGRFQGDADRSRAAAADRGVASLASVGRAFTRARALLASSPSPREARALRAALSRARLLLDDEALAAARALRTRGILAPLSGRSVFQTARQSFREFARYVKSSPRQKYASR